MNWKLAIVTILALSILLFSSSFLGPGPAATNIDDTTATGSCIQHERHNAFQVADDSEPVVTIHRTDNQSVIRYVFNGTGGKSMFSISLPEGLQVTNRSGFSMSGRSAEREYNAHSPWIEIKLGSPHGNLTYATSDENVVVPIFRSDDVDLFFQPNTTGYVGSHFALLGDYEVEIAHEGCQRVQVVTPESADLHKNADQYADAIATAGGKLAIGHRYRLVTAFVAPRDTGKRNGFTPERHDENGPAAEFYISPDSRLTTTKNTWIHEYIHTRQSTLYPQWMSEGAATYFAAHLSITQGWTTPRQYDRYLARNSAPNGAPKPTASQDVEYIRGTFFFTQVEDDLHDDVAAVESIYRRLNTRAMEDRGMDRIEPSDFETAVESETNQSVQYSNPMYDSISVSYLLGPEGLPHLLRVHFPRISKYIASVMLLGVLAFFARGDINNPLSDE